MHEHARPEPEPQAAPARPQLRAVPAFSPAHVLGLQRSAGNGAVTRLIQDLTLARTTVDFDETNHDRTVHTMDVDHAWDTLVALTGDADADYKLVWPWIQEAVDRGTAKNLGKAKPGEGQAKEFSLTVPAARTRSGQDETLLVKGFAIEGKDVFKVGDAWVTSNRRAQRNAAKKGKATVGT